MTRRGASRILRVCLLAACTAACRGALLDVPAVLRGHADFIVDGEARLIPLVLDVGATLGLCLQIPDGRDTSSWKGVLTFDGGEAPDGLAAPAARLAQSLCFEGRPPADLQPSRTIRVCGRVVDEYDGSKMRLPCVRVAFDPERAAARRLLMESRAALLARSPQPGRATVEALDDLAARSERERLPALAVNLRLIAIHVLTVEGTEDSLQEASRRLRRLPAWLDDPQASGVGALAALQWAELHLASGPDYGQAWRSLAEAERRFLRVARPERFTVTMKQAGMLSRMGATREARERLRTSIADCDALRCDGELLAQARSDLAWLVSLDPDASDEELSAAEADLESARDRLSVGSYPIEHALQVVNLAYLQVRCAKDPRGLLGAARRLLAVPAGEEGRARHLLDWVALFEGLDGLRAGAVERALERCRPLASRSDPTLSAWALSCAGQAEHRRGDLHRASELFERALERHEFRELASAPPVQLAPGRGTEDLLWAVRTAIDLGDAPRAWDLLRGVDGAARHERQRVDCRARASGDMQAEWRRLDREAHDLYGQLVASARPVSRARQRSLEPIRADLKSRLRELWRTWPGCASSSEADDDGVQLRAVALAEEIVLLERTITGAVRVARRTPMSSRQLRAAIGRITTAMAEGRADAVAWTALTAPLARALVPARRGDLPAVTTYALHGALQEVPLAALPLHAVPQAAAGAAVWLGHATTVAIRPAAAARAAPASGVRAEHPVFVVDPGGDLAGASDLESLYGRLFPQALMFRGAAATSEALRGALGRAAWLHLDAHGSYDSAFPELSAIVLADRPVALIELADLAVPREFANLSACRSGQGPTTPDAGRYGIAGLLVRRGVPWVVASATDLDDRVARDFNAGFYRRISRGVSAPDAYRGALIDVEERHSPAAWAALRLYAGAGATGNPESARLPHVQSGSMEVRPGGGPPGRGRSGT